MYGLFAYKEITALRTKHVYRLEIYKKDFSGTTMELEEFSSSPFSITLEGEGDEIYRPIIKSSLSINIIDKDQFDYTQFFTSDAFGFRVFLLRNGVRLWSGYITPDSFGQDLQYRSTINLVARDNIGYLSEIDYDWFDYDFVSIEQLLTKAFDKIQAQFSLDNRVNIFSGSKPITDAYIQTVGLKDKTWFEVLEEVLSGCGLQLRYINDNYTLHDIANEVELGGNYTPTFIDRSQRVDFSPAWREEQLEQDYLKLDSFYDTIIKSGDYDLSSKITTYTRSMDGQTEGAFVLYLYKQNFWYNANLVNEGIYVANPADAQSKYDYDYTVDAWVTHKKNSLLISSYNRDIDPNSFIYKWFYINKFSDKLLNIDISAWNILYHYNQSGGGIFYPVLYRGFSYYVEFTFNIFLEASEGLYCYSSNGWYSVPDFDTVQTRIILTGTESGYDVIINGSKQYTTKLEELNIQIGYAPFDGKLIVAIYKWTARNPDNDDIYGDDVIDQGYCMRIDNIKMYFKDEKEDISGQESKITINESNNVKQSFDFKYGQIPDSSGGYLAFAGGLHDNDDYHTPLTDWYRSAFPGNKYNLLELVGRGLAHHGKKARKIMTGTILFDGQDFSKILVIDNEKYVINGGTYDVTKETLTGEFIEVEPYSTDDYVITGGAVSGGSSNISTGGNRDTLLWTDNAANTKRVNELGMATSDDLAGSNLLIDNPEWSEAKRISADMLDDKFYWDKSLDTTEDKSDKDSWIIRTKHSIVSDKGISAYGLGSTSGGSASGSLGELVNVGQWADEVPTADRVMVQLAGATHWSAKPLADLVGLDTAALAQYLTANSYLKASDISSYLTWANLSGKPTVYPTNWANIADKPTVYPTTWTSVTGRPTKLSDLTDDVVAGNYLPKPTWDAVFEVVTVDGTPALKVKYDILGLKGITAYADGSLSGGSASGSLGELVNVGQWADEVPTADRVMVQLAGATHWSAKPLADLVGLDTAALAQYLTANSYLKASDISSYLTWANLSGKPTVYPTNWANIADKPTVYPTTWTSVTGRPTKLSDLTDDVVAGNYLPKPTWDAVFEVVTVDGTPALKVKYDILGLKGITAYADGSLSGGFSGALVDLVDVAVTNLASGDILKYNGTHFVNVPVSSIAGASSWDQITGKPEYYPTRWADVSGAPASLPASDVYPWAKAASKPTYTAAEVGAVALNGGGDVSGSINASAYLTANTLRAKAALYPTISFVETNDNSESLLIVAGNNLYYRPVASDATNRLVYHSGNFNPDSKFPYLGMGGVNDNSNEIGAGYSGSSAGGNFNGPFIKFGQTSNYMTELYNRHDQDVFQIRRMVNGEWQAFVNLWHSGNFNPDNYLLKTANAVSASKWATARTLTLTGSASGNVSMDGSANVSLSVTNNRLNSNSEMTYGWNGLNYFNTYGTAGAAAKTNDTPTTAWWHILRFNHGNSAGYYTDLAVPLNDNTLHYKRVTSGTLQNGGWVKIWDARNSNLSTVDWAAKNITAAGTIVSMSTVESRGNNSTGILPQMLWHLPGVSYTRIRMASDGGLHILNGGSEAYQNLYAQNLSANNTVTATKLVIGGITIDVYNGALRVNGNLVATGGVTAYQ